MFILCKGFLLLSATLFTKVLGVFLHNFCEKRTFIFLNSWVKFQVLRFVVDVDLSTNSVSFENSALKSFLLLYRFIKGTLVL
jgi:hypothetical protein